MNRVRQALEINGPVGTSPAGRVCDQEGCTASLSIHNPHKSCHQCLRKMSDDYVRRLRERDKMLPRQRILQFMQSSEKEHTAREIAIESLVPDNETYRLLQELRRGGHISYSERGRKWQATTGHKSGM